MLSPRKCEGLTIPAALGRTLPFTDNSAVPIYILMSVSSYIDNNAVPFTDNIVVPIYNLMSLSGYIDSSAVPFTNNSAAPFTDNNAVPFTDNNAVPIYILMSLSDYVKSFSLRSCCSHCITWTIITKIQHKCIIFT